MRRFNLQIGILALIAAAAMLIAFGVVGIGRGGDHHGDGAFFYEAGRLWLQGKSPYLRDNATTPALAACPFAYPPQASLACMALGLMSLPAAMAALTAANLIAAGVLAWLTYRMARDPATGERREVSVYAWWLLPAIVLGNPFTAHNTWMGQTTLIAAALIAGGWWAAHRGRPILGGVLLGLATFKAQLVLLPLIWLALDRRWRVVFAAGAASLLLAAYPFVLDGPVECMRTWLESVKGYRASPANVPGFRHVIGLQSLLASAGVRIPDLIVPGVAMTGVLWALRRRFCRADVLAVLTALYLGVMYGHDYDLVLLAPAAGVLALYAARSWGATVVSGATLFLLCMPQRLVRGIHYPPIEHWRTVVLLGLLGWLLVLSAAEARRRTAGRYVLTSGREAAAPQRAESAKSS